MKEVLEKIVQEGFYTETMEIVPSMLSVTFQTLSQEERLKALEEVEKASEKDGENTSLLTVNVINLKHSIKEITLNGEKMEFKDEGELVDYLGTLNETIFRKIHEAYSKFVEKVQIKAEDLEEREVDEAKTRDILQSIILQGHYEEEIEIFSDYKVKFKSLQMWERQQALAEIDEKAKNMSQLRALSIIYLINLKYGLKAVNDEELDVEAAEELLLGLDENLFNAIYQHYILFTKMIDDVVYNNVTESVKN